MMADRETTLILEVEDVYLYFSESTKGICLKFQRLVSPRFLVAYNAFLNRSINKIAPNGPYNSMKQNQQDGQEAAILDFNIYSLKSREKYSSFVRHTSFFRRRQGSSKISCTILSSNISKSELQLYISLSRYYFS